MEIAKTLKKIIEYGLYVLFFVTPLLFNPSRTFPSAELFEFPKMMFVYGLTAIIVGAWITLSIIEKKIRWQKTPFDIPLLLFLASAVLSTLFSIDQHVSLFGYYSRFHGGLLSTICYILLFYAFVANREFIRLKLLLLYAFGSGLIVALYGILQKYGIDAHMWVQDVRSRVFSTFGQPNWLAAYMVVLALIALGVLLQTKLESRKVKEEDSSKSWTSRFFRWYYKHTGFYRLFTFQSRLPIYLGYITLLYTKSRSGFLGFWIANILFWLVSLFFASKRAARIILGILFILYILSAAFFIYKSFNALFWIVNVLLCFALLAFVGRKFSKTLIFINAFLLFLTFLVASPFSDINAFFSPQVFHASAPPVEEKAPIGDSVINVGITDSADIRRIVWKGALNIARDYPLFGTGPETFAYAYYKYRPAAHNLTSEWDFLYNRAHNEFLNYAATQGFLGLGLYLAIILVVYVWTTVQIFKQPRANQVLLIALLAAYTSIHITNFFGFSVVVIGLYFYLIPAFILTLTKPKEETSESYNPLNTKQILLMSAVGLAALVILLTVGSFWAADSLYAQAQRYSRQESFNEAHPLITSATTLRPGEPVYHDERATVATNLALQAFSLRDATHTAELMREAVDESSKALTTSPQNVNFWKSRTRIFFAFAEIDPSFFEQALRSIQIARELAPTDAKIAYNMAVALGRLDRNQEAIETLTKTIDLKPDYRDAYVALAIFYEEEKQPEEARKILTLALTRINPNDDEIKQRLEQLK